MNIFSDFLISNEFKFVMSLFSNKIFPLLIGTSLSKERPVVDLPQPDSPTRESVSEKFI